MAAPVFTYYVKQKQHGSTPNQVCDTPRCVQTTHSAAPWFMLLLHIGFKVIVGGPPFILT